LHLTKSGGSEAGKPWSLKSGELEPRILTEVDAYETGRSEITEDMSKACLMARCWCGVTWQPQGVVGSGDDRCKRWAT